jgi:hypothetical protein
MSNMSDSEFLDRIHVDIQNIVDKQIKMDHKSIRSFGGQIDSWDNIKCIMTKSGGIDTEYSIDEGIKPSLVASVFICLGDKTYQREWLFFSMTEAFVGVHRLNENALFRHFEDQDYTVTVQSYPCLMQPPTRQFC